MQVAVFEATPIGKKYKVRGFYSQCPAYATCLSPQAPMKHYPTVFEDVDWGFPYKSQLIEIDPSTLKEVYKVEV